MKFVILALVACASTAAAASFCAATGTVLTTAKCTGTDGNTAATATCSCGTNDVQVANTEFCFIKTDKTGAKSTAAAVACSGNKADGTTAAGGQGCYCGTGQALTAANKFCKATGFAATGSVLTTAACTGTDGNTAATATCSCGSNDVQVANTEFCFLKTDKTGAKSTAAAVACASTKADGTTAPGGQGCYCGTGQALTAAAKFCCAAAPTKAP